MEGSKDCGEANLVVLLTYSTAIFWPWGHNMQYYALNMPFQQVLSMYA